MKPEQHDENIINAIRNFGGERESPAPVAALVKRGRAARGHRIEAIGAASLGLVGLAATLTLTAGAHTASGPETQISFAMAAEVTAATSFHITITELQTLQFPEPLVLEGAYDPAHKSGYLDQVGVGFARLGHFREVEGTDYGISVTDAADANGPAPYGRWEKLLPGSSWFEYPDHDLGTSANPLGDPDGALKQLAANGSAKLVSHTGSGANEVETWSFSYTELERGAPGGSLKFSGTAIVDVATQHVTELVINSSDLVPERTTYTYSDFGAPVNVTAPTIGAPAPSIGPGPSAASDAPSH